MESLATVQVPAADAADLESLRELSPDGELEHVHPFDGDAIVQILVTISAATLPYFQSWMDARVASRKSFEFRHRGTRIAGASADDVTKILKALDESSD
jgi:hypothetical protein